MLRDMRASLVARLTGRGQICDMPWTGGNFELCDQPIVCPLILAVLSAFEACYAGRIPTRWL